ncbi:MAG: MMPL family transporter [Actinomycetota bacterium]
MRRDYLERHGRRMARRRWWVVGAWIALMVVAVGLAARLGEVTTTEVTLPGTEAQRGITLIQDHFADGDYTTVQPVFRRRTLTVDDPAYRREVTAALDRAARVVPGTQVVSYFSSGSRDFVGDGGHLTYATLRLPIEPADAKGKVEPIREALGTPAGFEPTLLGGQAAIDHDTTPIFDEDLKNAELIAFPIALLILLLVFGSAVSALLPIAISVVTILGALGATFLVGQATTLAVYVTNVISLIGIGIGIDYSLLVVSRFREELAAGRDREDALARTVATAGHAVLFSGLTVAIGLATLVLLGVPFMRSMGIGGMLVPLFAVLAGLTLLPALLAILGPRVNAGRVVPRRLLERRGDGWGRLARWIMRRAVPVFTVTAVVMLALAVPSLSLSVNNDALEDLPGSVESVQAGRVLQDALGGAVSPDTLVIDSGRPGGVFDPATVTRLDAFADGLRQRTDLVRGVAWPSRTDAEGFRRESQGLVDPTGRYALMNVAPLGDPLSDTARDLNDLLEDRKGDLAAALPGGRVTLTGEPALMNEFNRAIYGPFPWLVLLVLVVSYAALLRAFRSVVLPLKAVILNVISILATYGLLVLVFQEGVGRSLFGVDHDVRGIAAWIPVMLFAFLFGLSMDYEVFLVSRMRELYDSGLRTQEAVAQGLQRTGRLVTSAALIMVVAFSGFIMGTSVDLKIFGFGLAAAIAIDATIVRALLVPALMRVLGDRNWALPARVARIARVRPARAEAGVDA